MLLKAGSISNRILWAVVAVTMASSQALAIRCEPLMSVIGGANPPSAKKNGDTVEVALEASKKAQAAIEQFKARLGVEWDITEAATSLQHMIKLFQQVSVRLDPNTGELVKFTTIDGKVTTDTPGEQLVKLYRENIGNKNMKYDPRWAAMVLQDAAQVLAMPFPTKRDLHSAALGLRRLQEYLYPFTIPGKEVDLEGKELDKKQEQKEEEKKEDKKQDKKDKNKKKKPAEPKFPQVSDSYTPSSDNDIEQMQDGEPQEPYRVVDYNDMTKYFKRYNFNFIGRYDPVGMPQPFLPGKIPFLDEAPVPPSSRTAKELLVRTEGPEIEVVNGKKVLDLYYPPGLELLQPHDPRARIFRLSSGAYRMVTDLSEVRIPLIQEQARELHPEAFEYFTRPVGYKAEEFPEKVRVELFNQMKGLNHLQIASGVEQYLQHNFKYNVKPTPEKEVIAAIKRGAFQCSMAAYIMVTILRDVFKVPSRAVGGYKAKYNTKEGLNATYLITPGEAHAWVEAYIGGKWVTFDPTPHMKDKELPKKPDAENPYQDVATADTKDPDKLKDEDMDSKAGKDDRVDSRQRDKEFKKKIEAQSEKSLKDQLGDKGKKGKDGEEDKDGKGEKDSKGKKSPKGSKKGEKGEGEGEEEGEESDSSDSSSKSQGKNSGKGGKPKDGSPSGAGKGSEAGKEETKGKKGKKGEENAEDVARSLNAGSLTLKPPKNRNPFIDRALRVLLRESMMPNRTRREIIESLTRIEPLIRDEAIAELLENLSSTKKILEAGTGAASLSESLEGLRNVVQTQNVNKTYAQIHGMIQHLERFSETLDFERGRLERPTELLSTLRRMRASLYKLSAPTAADIAGVRELVRRLPPLSRSILREDNNFDEAGPNTATSNIANKIRAGKLQDTQLIAALNPVADFIQESEPVKEYLDVKALMTDPRFMRGADMVRTQRATDIYKGFSLQSHKSAWDNYEQGTQYNLKRRRIVKVPFSQGTNDDIDRVTIVLYDTSGSMNGDPADFQAGLIATFVDKALSDVSASGKIRHKAIIIPFDDKVYQETIISDPRVAKDVIRNYRQKLANTNGGTKIEQALLHALGLIADAQKRHGEPLRKANIILMTDGQDTINLENLMKKRAAIDRKTPIDLMFVAIGTTNPQLMDYATEHAKAGFAKGHYRQFMPEDMAAKLKEAKEFKIPEKEDAFYTQKTATDIPGEVFDLMDTAARQARAYNAHLMSQTQLREPRQWKDFLETIRQPEDVEIKRPLESLLLNFRSFVVNNTRNRPILKDRNLSHKILDDILRNFGRLSGLTFETLTHKEMENIRHLLGEIH